MRLVTRLVLLAAVALCLAMTAEAQVVTITEETFGSVKKITVDWTSDAGGDASGATTNTFNGEVLALVTDPDGVSAPTDNYDLTITDGDGVDVLATAGVDRDTATTESVVNKALLGVVANDLLTVTVANAGNATKGKVFLFIR